MKKKIAILLMSAMSVCCVASSVSIAAADGYRAGKAENAEWGSVSLSSDFEIGQAFTFPDRTLTVDGKSYDATVKLFYPDGTALQKTSTNTGTTLSVAGEYTLLFEVRDEAGKYHCVEETFTVTDKLWKMNNRKSTASYGLDKLAEEGNEGLCVSLQRGDTLTFGKIIDLSKVTKDTKLITGYITPTVQGSADFDSISFTFTDVYNPEISMTVTGMRSKGTDMFAKGISYWTANGNGQLPSGFEDANQFHHGDGYGAKYMHSWSAMKGEWSPTNATSYPTASNTNPFSVSFDPESVKAYVGSTYITDLDDPLLHDGEEVWKGFESNKVMLTISAEGVTGEAANFCITSVLGYEIAAETENVFVDTEAPMITLRAEDGLLDANGNYIPYAVVGGSFPVADATAFDEYAGYVDVKTEVFYNYADPEARIPCLVTDGRFDVNYLGAYTVVYTATDYAGNVSKLISGATAVEKLQKPLSVSVKPETTTGWCGERIELAKPVVTGGSGNTDVEIIAYCDDKGIVITDGWFMPECAGTWMITYTASDVTRLTAETFYTIKVEAKADPCFTYDPVLPRYLLSGMSYTVPEVYATDYSSGEKTEVLASLIVKDATGEKEYKAGEKFVPTAASHGDKTVLTFKAGGGSVSYEIETLIAHEDGMLRIEKMFVNDGYTYQKSDKGLQMTATRGGDVAWTFANAVAAKDSGVTIEGVKGKDAFKALQVTFTDSADESVAVTVNILNTKGKNARILFGDADRDLSQGFSLSDNVFDITFNGAKFAVGNVRVNVSKTDGGAAFTGFPSGKVYISAKLVGAEEGASYTVSKIDNNVITNLSFDGTKPRIVVNGDYGGVYSVGDRYVINSAIVSDTVDPSATLTVTVKTPSGKIATDINGKELKAVPCDIAYEILLQEVGQYKVDYLALDSESNKGTLSYGINLIDRVAPTVVIEKSVQTVTVGDKLALPVVYASDDVTTSENLIVYLTVRNPEGVFTTLGYDRTISSDRVYTLRYNYTFRYEGKYTFTVLVMDEAGNQTLSQYVINAQAKQEA